MNDKAKQEDQKLGAFYEMNNYEWRAERDGKFENQGEMRKNE